MGRAPEPLALKGLPRMRVRAIRVRRRGDLLVLRCVPSGLSLCRIAHIGMFCGTGHISYFRGDGSCVIGLTRAASLTLLIYDLYVPSLRLA